MTRFAALVLLAGLSLSATAAIDPFVVQDIRLNGLSRISAGTVYSYLPVEKGDTIDRAGAAEAIRA
ncbi:MAG: hypothetical protein KAX77_03025, partial [Xanthomonadales bacterium]|nr:hypothetical protein [Xanthomonadales bacterium]